jgi:hypothetical protein
VTPTKVRVRSTVSRRLEVCLPMAGTTMSLRKRAFPPLGVSKTALLSPIQTFLWEDRCTFWVCRAHELPTVRRSAQHVHRAEATVHRAVAVGVFDSRIPQPSPRLLLVCDRRS